MSQITEMQLSIEKYLQKKIKNAVVTCEIETDDFMQDAALFAVAVIATTGRDEMVYSASERTRWYRAEQFTIDEISDELDFVTRSIVCRLGFEIFEIKETR